MRTGRRKRAVKSERVSDISIRERIAAPADQ